MGEPRYGGNPVLLYVLSAQLLSDVVANVSVCIKHVK